MVPAIRILPTRPKEPPAGPFDTLLFSGRTFDVGRFDAHPDHPSFADSGPARGHLVVFPHRRVSIRHDGEPSFVADPNTVTFYNRGQSYRRAAISPDGDRCVWFSVSPDALSEVLWSPGAVPIAGAARPFGWSHTHGEASAWGLHELIVRHLEGEHPDPWLVEDVGLSLLRCVCRNAERRHEVAVSPRARILADAARREIGRRYRDPGFTLDGLSAALGCSVFHLCRTFRTVCGSTLHAYREGLRLRAAVYALRRADTDLTTLALDLGYSSHSHFTAAFRRGFGAPPSALRGHRRPADIRQIADSFGRREQSRETAAAP